MELISTTIPDVLLLRPRCFRDERGYFMESFNEETFRRVTGLSPRFVQDNEAYSRRGVVRGLHYQLAPHAQAKLVRVVSGRVLDVAVDIRKSSPTFGRYVAVELSAENGLQLYIPEGFAHGYAVLSDEAVFQYKCRLLPPRSGGRYRLRLSAVGHCMADSAGRDDPLGEGSLPSLVCRSQVV